MTISFFKIHCFNLPFSHYLRVKRENKEDKTMTIEEMMELWEEYGEVLDAMYHGQEY